MKKVPAKTLSELETIALKLEELHEELDKKCEQFEQEAQRLLEDANRLIGDAAHLQTDLCGEMDEYWEGRSEKWQASEKGEAYQHWMEAWAGLYLEPLDTEVTVEAPEIEVVAGEIKDLIENHDEPAR